MRFYNKYISLFLFAVLFVCFTTVYFSYFPGVYSYDSYFSYSQSLGLIPYMSGNAPTFTIFWQLFNNANYGPFIANYTLVIIGIVISYRKTRTLIIGNMFLSFLLLPATLLTYIWVWKDNTLISLLFLAAVIMMPRKNVLTLKWLKVFEVGFLFIILFFAFSVRLNGVFAIIPVLFYLIYSQINSKVVVSITTIAFVFCFFLINQVINKYIYRAQSINFTQTLMYTDIVKLNYYWNLNVELPTAFRTTNYAEPDIKLIMQKYDSFSCNDILYMANKYYNDERPIVSGSSDESDLSMLRAIWLKTILLHPFDYLDIRWRQLYNALSHNNISLFETFDATRVYDRNASGSVTEWEIDNKLFNTIRVGYTKLTFQVVDMKTTIGVVSSNLTWFVLNIVSCFLLFIFRRKQLNQSALASVISLSGICYVLGYFPILPCTDYRYFIWNIASFWLSIGIFITLYTNNRERK